MPGFSLKQTCIRYNICFLSHLSNKHILSDFSMRSCVDLLLFAWVIFKNILSHTRSVHHTSISPAKSNYCHFVGFHVLGWDITRRQWIKWEGSVKCCIWVSNQSSCCWKSFTLLHVLSDSWWKSMLKCYHQWQPFWTKGVPRLQCLKYISTIQNTQTRTWKCQQSPPTPGDIHWGTVDYVIAVHDSTVAHCLPCRCCTQIHQHQWLKFISRPSMFVAVPPCTRQTNATMLPGTATDICPKPAAQ